MDAVDLANADLGVGSENSSVRSEASSSSSSRGGAGPPRGWCGPRTVVVPRADGGFGFTLRHFIVYPPDSLPPADSQDDDVASEDSGSTEGTSRGGGAGGGSSVSSGGSGGGGRQRRKRSRMSPLEPMDTIFVKQVKEASPAQQAGLHNGDRIVSVNGQSVSGKTYSQVIALIQASDQTVKLLVVPKDEDILQMAYRTSAYTAGGATPYRGSASNIPNPPPQQQSPPASTAAANSKPPPVPPSPPTRYKSELQVQPDPTVSSSSAAAVAGGRSSSSSSSASISISQPMGRPPSSSSVVGLCRPLPYGHSRHHNLVLSSTAANASTGPGPPGPGPRQYSSTSYLDTQGQRRSCPTEVGAPHSRFLSPPGTPVWEPNPKHRAAVAAAAAASGALSGASQSHPGNLQYVGAGSPQASTRHQAFTFSRGASGFEVAVSQAQAYNARHSVPDRQMINLVTERMKKFESCDSIDSDSGSGAGSTCGSRTQPPLPQPPQPTQQAQQQQHRFGYDSVASRTALFENLHDVKSLSNSSLPQAQPPDDLSKSPLTPPATINIYFRKGNTSAASSVERSPERLLASPPQSPRRPRQHQHKPALRQASYLSAVNSPHSQCGHARRFHQLQQERPSPSASSTPSSSAQVFNDENQPPPPAYASSSSLRDSQPDNSPILRDNSPSMRDNSHVTATERESKLQRRTSYLMATRQVAVTSSSSTSSSSAPGTAAAPAAPSAHADPPRPPPLQMPPASTLDVPEGQAQPTTPTKTSNIKKLKAFFGEKTPCILEATAGERKSVFDLAGPASSTHVLYEGTLNCKIAVTDGKRASDRSWRPQWGVLRGCLLYLFKDKANTSPSAVAEPAIPVRHSLADVAHDYTKKRHVFRLTTQHGSEYLFQADDNEAMLAWIRALKSVAGEAALTAAQIAQDGSSSQEVTRKTLSYHECSSASLSSVERGSPALPPSSSAGAGAKKTASRSVRAKSPGSHSPGMRQKKQSNSTEHADSPKSKDQRSSGTGSGTWKGKMAKKFRRYGSSSSAGVDSSSVEASSDCGPPTANFGVPLELCTPATVSEYVPFVVELCTQIVEARGMEYQGIYRVPGNTGAVTSLQTQLDKGIDHFDLDNEKLMDVNVVSSLLKSFFRKLPEALVTEELYDRIINANRIEDPVKRMLHVKSVLQRLPDHNLETFRYLAEHLHKVSLKGDVNKMDTRNLAIVFGPTLIRTTDESMVTMVKDMSDQCRIIESVIAHWSWFFGSWDEDVYVPVDEDVNDPTPISSMNQQLLHKAENLELGERGRDLSAKDLVTGIFSAANKKIRKRDKSKSSGVGSGGTGGSGGDSIDVDLDSESYSERNIDHEIAVRKGQDTSSTTTTSSTVLKESKEVVQVSETDGVSRSEHRKDSAASSVTVTSAIGAEEAVMRSVSVTETKRSESWDTREVSKSGESRKVVEAKSFESRESRSVVESNGRGPVTSEHEHDELNHRPAPLTTPVNSQQEVERAALREKEAAAWQAQQQRAAARARIERELLLTRAELEQEDSGAAHYPGDPRPSRASHYTSSPGSLRGPARPAAPLLLQQPTSQRRGSLDSLLNTGVCPGASQEKKEEEKELRSMFDRKWQMLHEVPAPRLPPSWQASMPQSSASPAQTAYQSPSLQRPVPPPPHSSSDSALKDSKPPEHVFRQSSVPRSGLVTDLPVGVAFRMERAKAESDAKAEYAAALRKSTEKLYGSRERLLEPEKKTHYSPPRVRAKKSRAKKSKEAQRRHTVGGSGDLEHFKALIAVVPGSWQAAAGSQAASAWERLQPAGGGSPEDRPRHIKDWQQRQQRLRQCKSSPNLMLEEQPLPRPTSRPRPFHHCGRQAAATSSSASSGSASPQHSFTFESSI